MVGRFEVYAAGFSQRCVKIEVWVRADGFDPILEEFANRLASLEPGEAQFVLAERRRQLADPTILGWSVSHDECSSPHPFPLARDKDLKAAR